jgi:hypothetical protein
VRHVRMLGLCLVAMFAVAAMAASSALAGPQWVKCEKIGATGGKYSGPNCTSTEKAKPTLTGEYELYKAKEVEEKRVAKGKSPGVPFTGKNVGSGGLLEGSREDCSTKEEEVTPNPWTRQRCEEEEKEFVEEGEAPGRELNGFARASVECAGETSSGETLKTNKVTNVHVTFTGCDIFETIPCENAGPEEIKTNELKGSLGYINKSAKEVGVLLEPVKKHGAFVTFECPGFGNGFVVGVGNNKEGTAWVKGTKFPSGCVGYCVGATPEEEKLGGYDGIISPIVPVNKTTSTYTQEYKTVSAPGEGGTFANDPSHFEGKHVEALEVHLFGLSEAFATEWGAAGEEITNVVTPEEESEIKA